MKRMDGVKKSPIFANFDETINGITSVRGYQVQDRFIHKNHVLQDESQRVWNNVTASQRYKIAILNRMLNKNLNITHQSIKNYCGCPDTPTLVMNFFYFLLFRWMGVWLESLGAFIVFFASLFSVIARDSLSGGDVGVSVSYALQVSILLTSSYLCLNRV